MSTERSNGTGHTNVPRESYSKVEVLEQVDLYTQRVRFPNGQEVFRVTPLLKLKELQSQEAQAAETNGHTPSLAWEGSA